MKISFLNSLKFRMPLVVLVGILPLVIVAIFVASDRAAKTIRKEAKENLAIKTQTLAESVARWEESNILALAALTEQPAIISMNPQEQTPVLETIANNYRHIYLAHTVDQDGWILARSDGKDPGGYRADRTWFKNPMAGVNLTRQLLISRTLEQPALCLSTPIQRDQSTILGVTAICSDLKALSQQVGQLKFGETGYAFIVDETGAVLAHPDPKFLSGDKLKDVSYYPPVKHFLSQDADGEIFTFFDSVNKISYQVGLDNGWSVIVVQEQAEFFKSEREFKNLAYSIAGVAVIAVSLVTGVLANHLIAPISDLTKAASAVANGKFEGKIRVERKDELGILANAFNQMKADLKNLFASLEQRIDQRTAQLKKAKETAEQASAIALAANQSKDRFMANISHELRTPLNSIIGYNRLAQKDETIDGNYARYLNIVEQSSIHLLNIINDLLDVSQFQLKQIKLYPTDVELESFLDTIVDMVSMQAQEKGLVMQCDYKNLPAGIRVDAKRLRQVLLNLLSNAIKFTNTGKVLLKVSGLKLIQSDDDSLPQQILRFGVIDSGVGMSQENIQKIFQPFEQVGKIESRASGVGLGLSIASDLVKLMGGELKVKSRLNVGSMFWFDIAVPVVAEIEQSTPKTLTPQIITPRGTKPKILVVDDKPVNRDLLVEMLEPRGFQVFTANNGEQLFEMANKVQPDLILLDLFMPVKTGFTSAKELQQNSQFKNIPIIVVTASSITKEMSSYLNCEAVLNKPIDEQELLTVLNQSLAKSVG